MQRCEKSVFNSRSDEPQSDDVDKNDAFSALDKKLENIYARVLPFYRIIDKIKIDVLRYYPIFNLWRTNITVQSR